SRTAALDLASLFHLQLIDCLLVHHTGVFQRFDLLPGDLFERKPATARPERRGHARGQAVGHHSSLLPTGSATTHHLSGRDLRPHARLLAVERTHSAIVPRRRSVSGHPKRGHRLRAASLCMRSALMASTLMASTLMASALMASVSHFSHCCDRFILDSQKT